ncbi:multidrug transporter [Breznakiellaceae bacterium SP9]
MDIFLQIWGGVAYLLAKIVLSHAEGLADDRKWRIAGWISYIIGVPAWVILLVGNNDWIAAANEAGGLPSLCLGLVLAWKRLDKAPRYADWGVTVFTWLLVILGICYSVYHFGGITEFTQILEMGITIGFLLGTYCLAKKIPIGWFLFVLMLCCTGTLMFLREKTILIVQQAISLVFVINGFRHAISRRNKNQPQKS